MDEWQAEAAARVGTNLGEKWHLEALLGVGGMGAVYGATHRNGTRRAIKLLHARYSRNQEVAARFLREARIANQISHPARVAIVDDDTTANGELYLVMEWLEGHDLEGHLQASGGSLSAQETLEIFDVVLDLLAECHNKNIFHRDIKPANIFLGKVGGPRLLDFGVARMRQGAGSEMTRDGTIIGTPFYMAPEQALGLEEVGAAADVFSVGACMYTALSGRDIRRADTIEELLAMAASQPVASFAQAQRDAPSELVAFIDRALAFQPELRFPTAAAMRDALRPLFALVGRNAGRRQQGHERGAIIQGDTLVEDDFPDETPAIDDEKAVRAAEPHVAFWHALNTSMQEIHHFGHSHQNTVKALFEAHRASVRIFNDKSVVAYEMSPLGFDYGKVPVWAPTRPPFDRAPYALFGDGARRLFFRQGLSHDDIARFVDYLYRVALSDVPTEDDSVSWFFERHFAHIELEAIEALARNDDEQLKIDQGIRRYRHFFQVEASASVEAAARGKNLSDLLRSVRTIGVQDALAHETPEPHALRELDPDEVWENSAHVYCAAIDEDERSHGGAVLAPALRGWASARVGSGAALEVVQVCAQIQEALVRTGEADARRATLMQLRKTLLHVETLRATLRTLLAPTKGPKLACLTPEFLTTALTELGSGELLFDALEVLPRSEDAEIRELLEHYVTAWAEGHERELAIFALNHDALAASLIARILAAGEAGQLVLPELLGHLETQVRLETLALMRDEERMRRELMGIFDRADANERVQILDLINARRLLRAGPVLGVRVRHDGFHELEPSEKRKWLTTLCTLNARRGEAALLEIMGKRKVLTMGKAAATVELAAQVLAELPPTPESIDAFTKLNSAWVGVSASLKTIAGNALNSWKSASGGSS